MDTLASKWVTKTNLNGAASSSSVLTSGTSGSGVANTSQSFANPTSDEVGAGCGSSYIDHFNS